MQISHSISRGVEPASDSVGDIPRLDTRPQARVRPGVCLRNGCSGAKLILAIDERRQMP